jgi:uncharacterized membrane protein
MNEAYVHLIVNHLPVFSVLFGLFILAWGLIRKNLSFQKLAMVLFIVGAIGSYIAVESGEGAEDILEEYAPNISHDLIHDHEEAAEVALWFAITTGGLALLGLFIVGKSHRYENGLLGLLLLAALATVGMLMYTAYEGGKIRHPEAHSSVITLPDKANGQISSAVFDISV